MRNKLTIVFLATSFGAFAAPQVGSATDKSVTDASQSQGKVVFDHWCASCHAPGPGFLGTAALSARYGGWLPAALEARSDLTPDVIAHFVRNGVSIMPPFRQTEITDADLNALAEYLSHGRSK